MQKNYPFEATLLQPQHGTFQKNNIDVNCFVSKVFQRFFVLLFLMAANFGYSQLTTENFESGIPATWAVKGSQAGTETTFTNNWIPTPTGGYLSSGGATVNPALNNTVGTTAEYFMITPQFLTPEHGEIRFMTKQGSFSNRGTTYQLRVSTANQPDITSFNVLLATWTEAQLNVAATTWEEKIVDISSIPGVNVHLAFVAITNQTGVTATIGDSWFVDAVRVISACEPVSTPTIVPGIDSANISWTHPTATSFGVEVVAVGAGHGTTGIPVTGTTYTAGSLNPSTSYDFYIITNCDSSTSSTWAGPFTFTTSAVGLTCPSAIVVPPDVTTTPYTLITNLNQYLDMTTYVNMNSQGMSCQPVGETMNLLSGNHAYLSYTPTTSGLINITQIATTSSGGGGNNCFNALSSVFVFDGCAGVGTSAGCLAAIQTTAGNVPVQIPNFYAQAGHTYIIVISSPFPQSATNNAGICFTFTISGSTCPSPSQPSLSIGDLLQTTATASWDNVQNLVSAWQYLVLPAASAAPTAAQSGTPTNTNVNNPISGLTPGADYNLYVRSVCGTPGPWSAARAFTTLCNPLPLPYYTGFDNATAQFNPPEPCWTVLNLNNDLKAFTFGPNAFSEPVAKFRTGEISSHNDYLVSPTFHVVAGDQQRLRFRYNIYGNWGLIVDNPTGGPGSFEVKMSVSGVGPNTFTTTILPLAQYTTAYNFIEIIVPLPNITGDINIAWIVPPGALQTGNWLYIDDVHIEDMPSCSEPAYPVVTPGTLTSNSVQVSWTNGFGNTQWELVAQPLGTGIPTATPAPGAVVNIVNTNPFTITGLDPSTRYEFYMRAYCSASDQSIWIGPINFNTLCIPQPVPYYESFNTPDPNTKKFCWSTSNLNNDNAEWAINGTDANIRPQPLTFFDPFVSYNDLLISVPVNAVGLKRMRFNYRVTAGASPIPLYPRGNFEVIMSPTPDFATSTTLIPLHDFTNDSFQEDSVLFMGTGVTYFAFRMPANMPNPTQTGIVTIDDFVIEDAPACPNPDIAGLTAGNITQTTANLSWTPGYSETQWEIVVQDASLGAPTGSGITVNTNPTYSAASLTQDTAYEYYVKAVCSPTESSVWVGPFPFRTPCNALPTPFLETFDTTSQTESCWTVYDNNADNNVWNLNQTVQPMFGNQMAALFTGTNGQNNDWLITPTLTAHAGQRLRFYYKTYNDFFEEDLKVMLSVSGVATNDFSTILYENNFTTTIDAAGTTTGSNMITVANGSGVHPGDTFYIPDFPIPYGTTVMSVIGNTVTVSAAATATLAGPLHVVFTHETINNTVMREMVINLDDHHTFTGNEEINIAFHTPFFPPNPWNYRGQLTFIDNVIVEDVPACPEVINISTSNILDVSADVNWETTGSATSWEISVQPYGTPAPLGNTLPAYLYTANTHPFTVTGLTPSTLYQYYVRAVCSGTSQSVWVGPFEILTKCDYVNVCQYTISVSNGTTGHVYDVVNVMQNGTVAQPLNFPSTGSAFQDYQVFLCSGVQFSLYWQGSGSGLQYSQAQIIIRDEANNIIWTSPMGLGTINTTIYNGVASCGVVTCPQPINLAVNTQGAFSWTPGGSETSWEVFVQPYQNGTIPQSGTIVTTPSYTPTAADFSTNPTAGTYEYLVRAVCGPTSTSYWSGPKVFIRNDESANAVRLQVNTGSACELSGADASFISATASTVPTSCPGANNGDIWYEFVATSKVHVIELSDFAPGSYYASAGGWPQLMMSLYEVQAGGSLVEKGCSNNNSFVAKYASELVVGNTYKIRLTLNSPAPINKTFHICITTPDLCDMDAFNYSFEKLPMQSMTSVLTIIDSRVVPGWRTNTDWGTMFFLEGNELGVVPYEGGQCVQLTQDGTASWDPNDPNIKGLYKDFDTSEITKMDFSFASATRATNGTGTTVQLFAGPPSGPFTMIAEDFANSVQWDLIQGTYDIPVAQTTTRFIFRTVGNGIGHVLDAANFKANVDITIDTADTTLDCTTTAMAFDANGVGEWVADTANPATTTIANPNSGSTNVSGFTAPGAYTFHWNTRYCDKAITITKQGTNDVPTVVTPVTYCEGATATTLTATAPNPGDSLMWYTQPIGGAGTTTVPTPQTTTAGTTSYYVSVLGSGGCEGPRSEIVVQVNALPTATISGTTTICEGTTATIVFNGTANATVTYTVNSGSNQTITLDSTGTATLTTPVLTADATYNLVNVTSAGTTTCTQPLTGSVLITVEALPTVTISATPAICEGTAATVTFNGTANATVTYTVDSGANQTITLNSSGTATTTTPLLTVDSTYTLVSVTAAGTLACTRTQTNSATIIVNALPNVSISGTTSICSGATATITFVGTANATVTYTVDSGSNQTILLDSTGNATITTPALSLNSTYTLVSVSNASLCSQAVTGNAVVTVGALPTAAISGTTTVCQNSVNPTITFTGANGAAPYTFTYTINSGANQTLTTIAGNSVSISVPTAIVGVFTYNLVSVSSAGLSSCSQAQTGSAVVTVNALPNATISGSTTICTGSTATISFSGTANATVTYTVDSGIPQTIVLDAAGLASITTSALTSSTTYTLVSVTASGIPACSQALAGSATITVNQPATPNVTFSYAQVCSNAVANALPVLTANFAAGGVFSSSTITVNPATGAITLPIGVGSHQITYTLAANASTCTAGGSFTATLTILSSITPVTGFGYNVSYCADAANDLPTLSANFTTGGVFSAGNGLIINPTTGEINIGDSNSGTYTITYTVAADAASCNVGGSTNFVITIIPDLSFEIDDFCMDSNLTLQLINTNFDSNEVTYTWTHGTNTIGSNSTLNVDDYLSQNPSLSLPLTFDVSVGLNGCTTSQNITIENNPCLIIPKGISPNNDHVNDTFDLSGYGVNEILIFNRYGTKVFSFSGNYTDQWKGQTDGGQELPDGTYFYSIHTSEGAARTGWVYINREY